MAELDRIQDGMLPTDLRKDYGGRIRSLELATTTPLGEMKGFYHGLLGLHLVDENPERLTVTAGQTRLTFISSPPEVGGPFYHFAFNIPENKILAAYHWQKQRVPLLPTSKDLQDLDFPAEVVAYRHWNAHAIFFFDPAGNVVEYIARHGLQNTRGGDFSPDDIAYASEIAFVVDDVIDAAAWLSKATGLGLYGEASEAFAAVGDEYGLLLIMKRGRVISFEAPERKAVSVFPTRVTLPGDPADRLVFRDLPYTIHFER